MKNCFYSIIFFSLILSYSTSSSRRKNCRCKIRTSGRIIGGNEVPLDAYPWSVSISVYKQIDPEYLVPQDSPLRLIAHNCMGVILNERFILTAAHCLLIHNESYKYSVGFGSNDLVELYGKRIKVEKFYIHPKFNNADLRNDIALAKLEKDIELSDRVQPACLGTESIEDYGSNVVLIGFGSIRQTIKGPTEEESVYGPNSRYLKEVHYKDISSKGIDPECDIYTSVICLTNENPGESICNGDSGGAAHLFFHDMLTTKVIGIASGTKNIIRKKDKTIFCNGDVVYTRISSYLDYIEKIIGKNYCQ